MPHYKNGITAKVGDIVKGIGYNIKHEIIGRVIALTVGNSCNVQVACITSSSKEWKTEYETRVEATVEYGECSAFEKVG